MNKRITTLEELEEYLEQKDLNNLFYCRQSITPSLETLDVILLGKYLQYRGIIVGMIGGTYYEDRFLPGNEDKLAMVKGSGVLIYQRNDEVKPLTFKYKFTNPQKWEKKKIKDIECENLEITHARPEYLIENPLNYVECKNRRVVDIWKEVMEKLNYLYPFSLFVDVSDILSGKRAKDYYQKEYPELIENQHKAVLIENFEGGAEELEQAYNGKYVFLDISDVEKFGNVYIKYTALVVPSQRMKEKIEEAVEKSIKKVPQNENNLIKIQRILYEEFVKNLFNQS